MTKANGVETVLRAMVLLLLAVIACALAAYLAKQTLVPLVLLCAGMFAYCFFGGWAVVNAIKGPGTVGSWWRGHELAYLFRLLVGFVALLAPVYVLCEFTLYLSDAWRVKSDPLLELIFQVPGMFVGSVGEFVGALWKATTGSDLDWFETGRQAGKRGKDASPFGAVLAWAGNSAWELVLGIVSGIATALILNGRGFNPGVLFGIGRARRN